MRTCLVIGLAATGMAVARVLRGEGADVVVIEDGPTANDAYRSRVREIEQLGAELIESPSTDVATARARAVDIVVPSPLVRPSHPAIVAALDGGVPVRSEIDLAGERATAPIVAVTGTNGKTTVATMTAAMLQASGVEVVAAGNLGRPLIEAVADPVQVVVAEVSSFQLQFAETFRPRVAQLLAITPDHLDWHGSFEAYVAAKARLVEHQHAEDLLVYDADDPHACGIAATTRARTLGVTRAPIERPTATVIDDVLVRDNGTKIAPVHAMRRALAHDRTNALTAAVAALEVGATVDGVRAALADYETMPHRVALVGEAGGVRWYDDSKATNPDATLRAVESFDSVVLLAGGRNKGLSLRVLRDAAPRLRAVVAFGEAGDEVVDAFAGTTPVERVASMHDAVQHAAALARTGDVVLLSPACASFDAYRSYGERGDDFAREVHELIGAHGVTS
ncbi:MAG TPA: UDP-N-acetylmuramoyl-L-alanine--D-glutamate ligase [Acidimicrobiia bacterium]|nr:UDP-N-acetylmuramoyl-L-alanine--D-glutamate ligase [Acidimicrobiia bacterium]